MKRIVPIFLAALSACSGVVPREESASTTRRSVAPDAMVLDFQTGFNDTLVRLYLDKELVLSETLSTDNRVGLARTITCAPRNPGRVDTEVFLDHDAHYSYSIELDRGRYIGFSKDLDSGQLEMEQSQLPLEYD
jgi:hypothetical protein